MEDHKKSKFSVTCNLLSQYLKQKGSLSDLIGPDMTPRPLTQHQAKGLLDKSRTPTTMCLLPGADVSEDNQTPHDTEVSPKSMDLFPQHAGFDATTTTTEAELKAQQLTIFYDGKVLVYDNFPADKADDLFKMANKEISNCASNSGFKVPSPVVARADANSKPNDNININNTASTSGSQSAVEEPENKPANASDMPIARRNSLHRFLAKRKDRINTKAPYQVHGPASSSQNAEKPDDVPAWLGLGRKDSKPDDREGSGR